jgi:hypothetical protein
MERIKKEIKRAINIIKVDQDYIVMPETGNDYSYNIKIAISGKSINLGYFDSYSFGDAKYSVTFVLLYFDNKPVIGVDVFLDGYKRTSNYNGVVIFENVQEGEHFWEIKKDGVLIDNMFGDVMINYNKTVGVNQTVGPIIVPKRGSITINQHNGSLNYEIGTHYFYVPKTIKIISVKTPLFWIIDGNNKNPQHFNKKSIVIQLTNFSLNKTVKPVYS